MLEIASSGDVEVTINNKSFTLNDTDGTYVLDCENKVITKDGVNASNIMLGDFPTFEVGENEIETEGTITSLTATYKKAYL